MYTRIYSSNLSGTQGTQGAHVSYYYMCTCIAHASYIHVQLINTQVSAF